MPSSLAMRSAGLRGGATDTARILLVDDQPANLRVLEAILEQEGFEIATATSGQECLDRLSQEPYDLVLMDVRMPQMDGITACERMKADPRFALLPVVFLTALTDRDSRVRGLAAGADDFLAKPFDKVELLTRVRNLVKVKAYHDLQSQQRQLLERELAERTRDLLKAERLATLGSLASGVAHELGNVASALNGTLTLIEGAARAGDPPDDELIDNLRRVAEHLCMHARNLLRLGQPGPEREERIDLGTAVEATLALLQAIGKTSGVRVEAGLPDVPVWVLINGTRLEQILVNLVLNAAHATAEAQRSVPVRVEVEAADEQGRVRVRVVDKGVGIADADKGRIFEPYYTTKPPGKGTGLGLTVVRQIVESYGGTVTIESRFGEGTTVELDLPATSELV